MAERDRPRAGRPSKLTPERREKLLTAIKAGSYLITACKVAGVHYATFRHWMLRGRRARRGEFREFFEGVERASAEAEVRAVALWQAEMPGNYQAARDFLARRFPERWSPRERLEHTGADGGPIEIGAKLTPEERRTRLLVLLGGRRRPAALTDGSDGAPS